MNAAVTFSTKSVGSGHRKFQPYWIIGLPPFSMTQASAGPPRDPSAISEGRAMESVSATLRTAPQKGPYAVAVAVVKVFAAGRHKTASRL